jgi:hypothetical protein
MFASHRGSTLRRLRIAVASLATVAAAMLLTAAPASAAPMNVTFNLLAARSGNVCTTMVARIPTDQYDTWGYLNNGAHARVQLWGDDPVWDNLLRTSGWAYLNAGVDGVGIGGDAAGIYVTWYGCYARSLFDEDLENDDEVYVKVTVADGAGYTLATAKSNVVTIGYIYG